MEAKGFRSGDLLSRVGEKVGKEPTKGERCDRRQWREKGAERVAAVGKPQARFDERSGCRAPQQGK